MERLDEVLDVAPEGDPGRVGPVDRLVVHVSEVHDVEHLIPALFQPAPQQVLEEKRPEISDMRVVIDGGAAGVERDLAGLERLEGLDLATQRVVQPEGHAPAAPALAAAAAAPSPSGPPRTVTCTRRCW